MRCDFPDKIGRNFIKGLGKSGADGHTQGCNYAEDNHNGEAAVLAAIDDEVDKGDADGSYYLDKTGADDSDLGGVQLEDVDIEEDVLGGDCEADEEEEDHCYGFLQIADLDIFASGLIIGSSSLVAYPFCYFAITRVKRKVMALLSFGLVFIFSLALVFIWHPQSD